MADNKMIDASILLHHLERRAGEMARKKDKTADPQIFKLLANQSYTEILALEVLVRELMESG
jgi:hypothetical protein